MRERREGRNGRRGGRRCWKFNKFNSYALRIDASWHREFKREGRDGRQVDNLVDNATGRAVPYGVVELQKVCTQLLRHTLC